MMMAPRESRLGGGGERLRPQSAAIDPSALQAPSAEQTRARRPATRPLPAGRSQKRSRVRVAQSRPRVRGGVRSTGVIPQYGPPPAPRLIPVEREMELLTIQHELRSKNASLQVLQERYDDLEVRLHAMVQNHETLFKQLQEVHEKNDLQRSKIEELNVKLVDCGFAKDELVMKNKKIEQLISENSKLHDMRKQWVEMLKKEELEAQSRAQFGSEDHVALQIASKAAFRDLQKAKKESVSLRDQLTQAKADRSRLLSEQADLRATNKGLSAELAAFRKGARLASRPVASSAEDRECVKCTATEKELQTTKTLLSTRTRALEQTRELLATSSSDLEVVRREKEASDAVAESLRDEISTLRMEVRRSAEELTELRGRLEKRALAEEGEEAAKRKQEREQELLTQVDSADDMRLRLASSGPLLQISPRTNTLSVRFVSFRWNKGGFSRLPIFLSCSLYLSPEWFSPVFSLGGSKEVRLAFGTSADVTVGDEFVYYLLTRELPIGCFVTSCGQTAKIGEGRVRVDHVLHSERGFLECEVPIHPADSKSGAELGFVCLTVRLRTPLVIDNLQDMEIMIGDGDRQQA